MAYDGKAPSAWTETGLISIEKESGNKILFRTITDTVDMDLGEKGFDTIATLSGGRLVKFTPETDSTVTLEMYPVAAGNYWTSTGEEAAGFFDLLHSNDSAYNPGAAGDSDQVLTNDFTTRGRYRLTMMWTNDTAVTDPTVAFSSTDKAALRISLCGYFTKVAPGFTDDIFKVTVTFKVPAFTKAGSACIQVASTDNGSSTTLAALATFTSAVNF